MLWEESRRKRLKPLGKVKVSYVIQRNEDGKYVAAPGLEHSYTKKLQNARVYESLTEAQSDKCGNETILPLRLAFR